MDLFNKSDNSSWNQTITAEQNLLVDYGVFGYILSAAMFVEIVACWLMNILVFRAVSRIGEDKLKVRFLMKNAIVGDMLLALVVAIREMFRLTGVMDDHRKHRTLDILCLNAVYDILGFATAIYQLLATMAVAIDRFYSISRPLVYHTMRYTKTFKVVFLFLIISVSIGVSLPLAVLKLGPDDSIIDICYKAFETTTYVRVFLPYLLVIVVFCTLIIYCSLFLVIAYHRYKTRDKLAPQNEKQNVRRRQISLAVTFFLVHITYVLLYLPAAVFNSVSVDRLAMAPELYYYLSQIFIIVYLANTLIDPLIYISRVPAVRDSVRAMVCKDKRKPST